MDNLLVRRLTFEPSTTPSIRDCSFALQVAEAREELKQKLKAMKAGRTRGDPVNPEGLSKLDLFRERKARRPPLGYRSRKAFASVLTCPSVFY